MRSPTVTVGLDGSRESLAAAGWAAGEAALRGAALRLVHVGEQRPSSSVPFAGNAVAPPGDDRSARMLREVRDRLAHRHPGLRIGADRLDGRTVAGLVSAAEESVEVTDECVIGRPGTHLTDASRDASLVVVGRRTRHAALGLHIGPVTQAVLQYAVAPVAVIPHD
ncbi:universal stress protein [Streptomyces marokkonensis]|uniref:Universal stress protein n=1 Tax=Streptomyces marokkonensis TaxID=324855 RepID=A0ABW6QJK0_9ACTN